MKFFKRELQNTIAIMTENIRLNSVKELINSIDCEQESDDNNDNLENIEKDINLSDNDNESDYDSIENSIDNKKNYCKDNAKFLEFLEIDLNNSNIQDNNHDKEIKKQREEIIENTSIKNNVDDRVQNENDINLIEIKEDRNELNLFTLNFDYKNEDIRNILLNSYEVDENIKKRIKIKMLRKKRKSNPFYHFIYIYEKTN